MPGAAGQPGCARSQKKTDLWDTDGAGREACPGGSDRLCHAGDGSDSRDYNDTEKRSSHCSPFCAHPAACSVLWGVNADSCPRGCDTQAALQFFFYLQMAPLEGSAVLKCLASSGDTSVKSLHLSQEGWWHLSCTGGHLVSTAGHSLPLLLAWQPPETSLRHRTGTQDRAVTVTATEGWGQGE